MPASVEQLQEKIRQHGVEVFHCYVMFLLGFMAGLGGGRGSKFLGARNGEVLIASMQVFSNLLSLTPRSVYWGYLRARANSFQANFITGEDLAIVRLACLSRVHDQQEFVALRHAWTSLDRKERGTLVEHLLADGIQQRAVIFTFLPDCIQHSMLNASVGLTRLLQVLVDLLKHLKVAMGNTVLHQIVFIDLSDFSEFITAVQNTFIFQTCISRCKLDVPEPNQRPYVTLEMTSNNWGRINEADTDLMSVDHRVREVLEKQQFLETMLTGSDNSWCI